MNTSGIWSFSGLLSFARSQNHQVIFQLIFELLGCWIEERFQLGPVFSRNDMALSTLVKYLVKNWVQECGGVLGNGYSLRLEGSGGPPALVLLCRGPHGPPKPPGWSSENGPSRVFILSVYGVSIGDGISSIESRGLGPR